ncbi:MAG: FAD-dependent oxidoreductase, partial [Actinomycetota bacterium]|nr:FAD-dependent oxidoreductase [Actinomycetota bacterium]
MTERLVVVGADAAGMSAASQARRRREDLEIVAFEQGRFTSYSACGIPYWIGDVVEERDALIARTPEEHRRDYDIDLRLHSRVAEIDFDRRRVLVHDVEMGGQYWQSFDLMLIATGAVPIRPGLEGDDGEGIYGLQTLEDGVRINRAIAENNPGRVVVIGGGYIGLEMAEALIERGLDVSLVEQASQPMGTLDPDMGALVADALRDVGVKLHLEEPVEGIELDDGRVSGVVTASGLLRADMVIFGLGVRPNVEMSGEAGIRIGDAGGIAVDRQMRTNMEGVWAAGDCTEKFHRVARRPVAIALGTHANKQGRVAGINIAGGYSFFPGVVGTAASRICANEVARTGLTEREAREFGFDYVTETVRSVTRAGYYPGASSLTLKVMVEKRSGRLLGSQIVGQEGAAKRIDVFATALWNDMTVEDLLNVDLSYAPPFSPVWDPVLIAARKGWQAWEAT